MRRHKTKPAWTRRATGGVAMQNRQAYYTTDGKVCAHLDGRVLRKRVKGSIHQLRQPPGWAIDRRVFEQARADGAQWVEVLDTESNRLYRATVSDFDRWGISFDRGFGEQVVLPLRYWQTRASEGVQLTLEVGNE